MLVLRDGVLNGTFVSWNLLNRLKKEFAILRCYDSTFCEHKLKSLKMSRYEWKPLLRSCRPF